MAFSTHDIAPDSPTNNFSTLNPLAILLGVTVSNGNLTNTTSTDNDRRNVFSSIAAPKNSGKFYAEFCVTTVGNSDDINVGVSSTVNTVYQNYMGGSADAYAYWGIGRKINNNSYSTYGSAFSTAGAGGIIGVLIDTDNGDLTFYLNNSSMGTAYTGINFEEYFFGIGRAGDSINVYQVNFGQDPTFGGNKSPTTTYTDANGIGSFYYDPTAIDSEALSLCTANLPDFTPTVNNDTPQDYFKAVTYTGNGTGQSITGIGFQPDLVWVKKRSASGNHFLVDSVSGANKELNSNNTAAQVNNTGGIQSLNPTSFTVGIDGGVNGSSETYVAWCWKAAGAPTADNSNTSGAMTANSVSVDGTLQSSYTPSGSPTIYPKRMSINTDAGFSIVKYVGDGSTNNSSPATVPSGLSDVDFVIVKNLDYGSHPNLSNNECNWQVYHKSLSSNHNLQLDNTSAQYDITTGGGGGIQINNGNLQLITRTVSVTWNANVNDSGDNYIAYCWHSVENYSKFGSYTGNGSADGPFVACEFRPAFVMWKRTNAADNWHIVDSARSPSNPDQLFLYPNLSNADAPTNIGLDLLSNGFKLRGPTANRNASGGTYIYMAFAEQPFKYSNAR